MNDEKDKLSEEQVLRALLGASVFATGCPWLDDLWAGGLNTSNIILLAARTGVGKTFTGIQIATAAARNFKNVVYFALEAEKYEMERRQLYYKVCSLLAKNYPNLPRPRYREWIHNRENMTSIESEATRLLEQEIDSLMVEYRPNVYTPELFARDVESMCCNSVTRRPDLIVLDHLHHFFLVGDEIAALKSCIHSIKRLHSEFDVPIIILAQLRKGDGTTSKNNKRTLPTLEDIRGTAALTDVATDVILISPVPQDKQDELNLSEKMFRPQYFYVAKSRTASEGTAYAAIVQFDPAIGRYKKDYILTRVHGWEDPTPLETKDIPSWAKGARRVSIKKVMPTGGMLGPRQYKDI